MVRERLAVGALSPSKSLDAASLTAEQYLAQPPEWAQAWDLLQAIADYEDRFGLASLWNLEDYEICRMAKKLAAEADELDALAQGQGCTLAERVDSIRLLVRCVGIAEDKPLAGLPAILRAQDPAWWRRRLRVHVARVVEAGAVGMGQVHRGTGGYVSRDGLHRRQAQLRRNAETLHRTLYRNEAGQVWALDELAALGTANPAVRGGELMTRIRGAEEYADARAHVGLFITKTLPGRFHAMKLGSGGRPVANKKYSGATPRDGQMWLRRMWQKVRAKLQRLGVRVYGLRVAEPHHDDRDTVRAYRACHRHGEIRADFRAFMEAMGGHACKRGEWLLRTAHRHVEPGQANRYGEAVKVGRIVGLVPQRGRLCGRWLVSRRIAWRPVVQEHAQEGGQDGAQAPAPGAARAALAAPWTGFNNCTARLEGGLRRQVFGRGDHEKEDWCTPQALAQFRAMQTQEAWHG